VYPSKGNDTTVIITAAAEKQEVNNEATNTLLLNEEEKVLEIEIISLIEREKLYLEPTINLENLASRIGKSRHQISKIINVKED
jgi:hypothetical protein